MAATRLSAYFTQGRNKARDDGAAALGLRKRKAHQQPMIFLKI